MPIVSNSRQTIVTNNYRYWDSGLPGYPSGFEVDGPEGIDQTSAAIQNTTSFRSGGLNDLPTKERSYEDSSTQSMRDHLRQEYKLRYDTGNEFSTNLSDVRTISHPRRHAFNPHGPGDCTRNYLGPIYPTPNPFGIPGLLEGYTPSANDLNAEGAEAFRLLRPTAPEAGLGQFLGELREKLPALVGLEVMRKGFNLRSLGSEHLNIEFGIKPFIGDIQKMALAVKNAHKIVAQYRRDSGRNVRRKATLREDSTFIDHGRRPSELYYGSDQGAGFKPWLNAGSTGDAAVFDVIKERVWFSGAFTYHLSEAHDFLGKMEGYDQLANKLLGTRITPELVWELTPWSWLIDWFTNIGGFLTNVQALSEDSLVLRYGYLMHSTECTRTWSTQAAIGYPWQPVTYTCFQTSSDKRRIRASPYGFMGGETSVFTARKLAILGALGLTHGPRGSGI